MDWKDIKPLKESQALLLVKEYIDSKGLSCKRIEVSDKKSPDFEILQNEVVKAYCEVKTPEHNLNPLTNMYHWDTTFYKLRRFLHTAVKQFKSYDPNHEVPWMVTFTSNHPQLNWTNFMHNVIGAVQYNGQVLKDFRQEKFIKDSDKDLLSIDLIVWTQVNYITPKIFEIKFFINNDSSHKLDTEHLTELLKITK